MYVTLIQIKLMKIRTLSIQLLGVLFLSFSFSACLKDRVEVSQTHYTDAEYAVVSKKLNLPRERHSFEIEFPLHMERNGVTAPEIDDAKATLGRVLFYDKALSANEQVSCASCHDQALAFSDDQAFSKGFAGQLTKRNSLSLASTPNFESSYNGEANNVLGIPGQQAFFFWDERAHTIAEQSKLTLEDDIEMGVNIHELANKLEGIDYYRVLFKKAYGTETVSPEQITEALEEFINSFVSVQSRFDEGLNKQFSPFDNFSNFTAQENLGKALFTQHCGSCHSPDFSSLVASTANNGLDLEYEDQGIGDLTGFAEQNGQFKIPFLRNIALTAPYMHDGRFQTLEEVINHYSEGIQDHPNLDFRLRQDFLADEAPVRMNFSEEKKAALVAFLHTLTDYDFVQDERYSDPFK